MWTIRFILIGVLASMVCGSWYFLRYRSRYEVLLENRIFNIALVIVYNCLCYLIVVLPPAGGYSALPDWLEHQSVRIGFAVVGPVLICAAIVLFIITLKQRKVIGAQDVKEGLITSGAYSYFRHPIYTGIIWVCLGLALVMRNPDGLLALPAIFVINLAQAIIEERSDVAVRFREQYQAYKQKTRMFGPIWLWSVVAVIILLFVGFA
jgi:protein-S-isoprenylcysteine O-methyltransferase Ste14